MEIAKIQSIEASNKIDGIFTTDKRLKELVIGKTIPHNSNEQEIAAYRDVLNTIHENLNYIDVKLGIIRQFHRDLYKFHGPDAGGKYKF
jgi:Fic family protein